MRSASLALILAGLISAACSQAEPEVVLSLPPVPDERLAQPPQAPPPVEVSDAADRTRGELLREAGKGSRVSESREASLSGAFIVGSFVRVIAPKVAP